MIRGVFISSLGKTFNNHHNNKGAWEFLQLVSPMLPSLQSYMGWRILIESNALWARVLRVKYCHGRCDIDMFVNKAGTFNAWKVLWRMQDSFVRVCKLL